MNAPDTDQLWVGKPSPVWQQQYSTVAVYLTPP